MKTYIHTTANCRTAGHDSAAEPKDPFDKTSDCDWTIKDVVKEGESAKATVGFDYQDMMTGSVEMSMIKEGDVWKIDGLSSPKFEKFTLKMDDQ